MEKFFKVFYKQVMIISLEEILMSLIMTKINIVCHYLKEDLKEKLWFLALT